MKSIVLKSKTKDYLIAQVDEEDYPILSRHVWHPLFTRNTVYAQRYIRGGSTELMHRMILGNPPTIDLVIDHINTDGLDNRKENLRWLPNAENIRRKYENSPDTGIVLKPDKIDNPWKAQISLGGKTRHVGYFPTKELAKEARDEFLEEWLKSNE